MRALRDRYAADPRVAALAAAQAAGTPLVLGALHGGLMAVLVAAWCRSAHPPRVVITGDPGTLVEDLEELGIVAAVLPEVERHHDAEDGEGGDKSGHSRRLAALEAFTNGALLVATPVAAEQPVPDLVEVAKAGIVIRPGQEHDLHALTERLVNTGYRVVATVEGRGEVAVRGGILDVFPWIGNDPFRIEFFGDQVEAIRRFDAFSQESIAVAPEAVLAAASGGGLATRSLWSELPPGPLCVLGDLALAPRLAKPHGRIEIRLARQLEGGAQDGASTGIERLRGDLRRGLAELVKVTAETATAVWLYARNDEAVRELAAHVADAGLKADAVRIVSGRISSGFRDLDGGLVVVHDFELAERAPVRRRAARVANGSPLSSLNDLRQGDHVVHLRHGVALFKGMATLEKRGFLEDFLLLEFAEGTKLYVPVDAIDLVQKYVGTGNRAPELDRIGGAAWAKRKAKAEKAIADMSAELLANAARRLAAGGIAFKADGPDMRRFEAAFPFEETEDQLAAVREIKVDMERPVAMDRLLCGDVGFGKTEVAMRAAFKAVAGGRQVAVLAPTTLLAEQHLETFSERFKESGAVIAGMTRFTSTKDKAAAIAKAAAGAIDVLVGTHALLTDKLKFARLGLLVVDEEHRFGVKHKERLRELRQGQADPVDVLTLSATPIPRTLHFSMLGIRDISVLAEAPAERLAVETRVAPWDDELLRHACERELDRQGQLFVVHHRVADLDDVVRKLVALCPRLRVDTVHGQMEEERIYRVMDAFRRHELDCLVATSIIESGIDIPNANTLFVTNAQVFGLAELHQLRGRIGRFTRQAYAYFLTPPHRDIGSEARERLAAIQEYADLGAGFKLAMRDLELRGAGNLLGGEQSGHVDAIGYELYTKLLGEAVERAKTLAGATAAAPAAVKAGQTADAAFLDLKVDAFIPAEYLETAQLKFELHKAIDRSRRMTDLAEAGRSARDRFGPMPVQVTRLFRLKAIRLKAREMGLDRIDIAGRQMRLHLTAGLPKALLAAHVPEIVHVQPDGKVLVVFVRGDPDGDAWISILCRMLGLDLAWLG